MVKRILDKDVFRVQVSEESNFTPAIFSLWLFIFSITSLLVTLTPLLLLRYSVTLTPLLLLRYSVTLTPLLLLRYSVTPLVLLRYSVTLTPLLRYSVLVPSPPSPDA